ncbi:transporter [Burkholderia multivorans]|uniref:BON domain-containing protein n=1 Tax=Burkholderia multivorans TaxID=87883 RepID=UPI000DAD38B8|nr:BON domain-containing protein [Burkholderia multivorans]RAA24751.1 transporter [Burkholderia multivorans]RAA31977.1 transporter [Burkholderia multivorans]RAA32431.1 transporter [Burkholderia multivorans]RAA40141.1 transporter [Burkholderia multivorans]RAA44132.1 transporter [Burkholderia multivorans]
MNETKHASRANAQPAPPRVKRRPPVAAIARILVLSCAWIAVPRSAAAEQGVGAKLASQASAVGSQLRDATIASRVRAALVAERGLASGDIDVQVRDHVAELTGTVPDDRQRATALRVVRDVDGVRGVRDKLQIRPK